MARHQDLAALSPLTERPLDLAESPPDNISDTIAHRHLAHGGGGQRTAPSEECRAKKDNSVQERAATSFRALPTA
eukprot:scaffold69899_cov35-Tisochrysis_lutea.AAC.3